MVLLTAVSARSEGFTILSYVDDTGEVLLEEFLKPLGLSQHRLALDIGVPARRINEIVLHKRRVTADTALRLARYFDMSPQFWLGLQAEYDLDVTADALGDRLERDVRPRASAS